MHTFLLRWGAARAPSKPLLLGRSNMATVCVEDIKAAGKLSNEALENMSVDEAGGDLLIEMGLLEFWTAISGRGSVFHC